MYRQEQESCGMPHVYVATSKSLGLRFSHVFIHQYDKLLGSIVYSYVHKIQTQLINDQYLTTILLKGV